MAAEPTPYDDEFFTFIASNEGAARLVVDLLWTLVQPATVVDVGCGVGAWTRAFADIDGCSAIGVDGAYVPRDLLRIPEETFLERDLTQPLALGQQFDLAVCLEVAEHLEPAHARSFVHELTQLAPAVLFSAAVPHQGGTNHVNEQWPSYWAALFAEDGFDTYDVIRPRIWHDERIPFYYRQNILLFSKDPVHGESPSTFPPIDGAHPELVDQILASAADWNPSLRQVVAQLPLATKRAIQRRRPGKPA